MQTNYKQIEENLFSRVVSKESSITNPSFRVYYGGVSGSVPFMWESQPGTPKHKFCDNSVPPLTPPPSYYFTTFSDDKPKTRKNSRSKLFRTLFLRFNPKKENIMPSSLSLSSSSWSSSSSSSSHSSTARSSNVCRRRRFLSVGSSFDGEEVMSSTNYGSRNPVLCFEINRDEHDGVIRGCYSTKMMKKALLSVVGRGSG
ncbi:hypothetical protein LguiB_035481 [Lonicera macranthoides]